VVALLKKLQVLRVRPLTILPFLGKKRATLVRLRGLSALRKVIGSTEYILSTIVGLNKAKTFFLVEELELAGLANDIEIGHWNVSPF
jgi:hypothetical protein